MAKKYDILVNQISEDTIRVVFDWENGPEREPSNSEVEQQYKLASRIATERGWQMYDPDDESGSIVVSPVPIMAGTDDVQWDANLIR